MTGIDLGPYPDEPGYEEALELDSADPLAGFRARFAWDDPDLIYLDGNSLGPLPRATTERMGEVVEDEWGRGLIRSWNEGWWDLHTSVGDLIAPLVGAEPGEVILSDSTSVNLFKLAVAALRQASERPIVLSDDLNFPGDLYVLEAAARIAGPGHRVEVVRSDGVHGPVEAIADRLHGEVALLSLSHTTYKSGYLYDMARLTEAAHRAGALVLWDLSHSVGAVPVDLGAARADLAVGCTYKYLNGGPGAPAFLYVRSDLHEALDNPISGWWGHARPFDFSLEYEAAVGIRRFHGGTIPVLSASAVSPGGNLVLEAGMDRVRAKSKALAGYLVSQADEHWAPLGFSLASPSDPDLRGSHLAYTHRDGWAVTRASIAEGALIPDFRTPDSIRLGLAPLYLSFVDLHTAVHRVRRIVEEGIHLGYRGSRMAVT